MAISLKNLRTVKADQPPRITIYGPPGIGKTTLASEFPNPIFLQCEDGTPSGVEFQSFGLLQDFNSVMDGIDALYNEPHDFNTVVLDSVTALQRLAFEETCRRGDENGNSKKSIEDFGYGKGYKKAEDVWHEFLGGLKYLRNERGMAIVLIAHSAVMRFDDPESVSYDRYSIDLHERLRGPVEREMDAIVLLKHKVSLKEEDQGFKKTRAIGVGGPQVWAHLNPKAAYTAKNRYGIDDFIYQRGSGFATMAKKLPAWGEPDALEMSEQADAA